MKGTKNGRNQHKREDGNPGKCITMEVQRGAGVKGEKCRKNRN
jgi:hypothetical protein